MNRNRIITIFVLLMSACFFFIVYGYKIIIPTNIEWLMKSDPGLHFLGWHFFRSEPWTFPLGTVLNYNYPMGTNIVFTDSIPLIAIVMKIFSSLLPSTFQYIGLWLLLSYIFQGIFASLLMRKITNNFVLILLGSVFFLLSPIMFSRAEVHMALTAHWLILASLYLYLSPLSNKIKTKWAILIIISSMIHFYLLVMVLAIWAGYLLQEIVHDVNKKKILNHALYALFTLSILFITMWSLGYFIISTSAAQSAGSGHFSMNLLAPFNPADNGLFFLKELRLATSGQAFEGFNYFGFGLLLLLVISLLHLRRAIKDVNLKKILPLLSVLGLLFLFALSNKVTLGHIFLIRYQYPPILADFANILRSSGRMFWPVYYAIIFAMFVMTIRYFTKKQAIFILSILLLLQIVDFYPWYSNRDLNTKWDSGFNSKEWHEIAKTVDHIVLIPPSIDQNTMYQLALYAANNNLSINVGYVAREDSNKRKDYKEYVMNQYSSSILQDRTLYIVKKENLIINADLVKKFLYGELDGYYIIAPYNDNITINKLDVMDN